MGDGREAGGRAYPFHTCGGWVPDGLDEFAPILLLVNGCLGEGSLRVRQGGLALRLLRCGGGGVSLSKFRNDVSLTPTLKLWELESWSAQWRGPLSGLYPGLLCQHSLRLNVGILKGSHSVCPSPGRLMKALRAGFEMFLEHYEDSHSS